MNTHPAVSQRRYDLDWLRVFAILIVFIFHTGRFFDTMDWHVKNPATYAEVQAWTMFLVSWMMPLIFVISGASLFFALQKGGTGRFLKDKVLRLLVPLVVGVFTHVALGVYLERITHYQFSGSFIEFFPSYFDGLYGEGGNFAWMGLHLWYLLVLFVFSVVFLPVLWLLKSRGQKLLGWLGNILSLPGVMYLLAAPIILVTVTVSPYAPLGDRNWGGWSLLGYLPFFFYGFIIISHAGLQETIRRWRWASLVLSLAAAAGMIYYGMEAQGFGFGSPEYSLFNAVFGLNAWLWTLTALGFGFKHLNFSNPFLHYANEAVMPFYVLHQTILLGVGYFVTRWEIADPLKFLGIGLGSFAIIIGLYEFIIRRSNLLRILFGMKARERKGLTLVSELRARKPLAATGASIPEK